MSKRITIPLVGLGFISIAILPAYLLLTENARRTENSKVSATVLSGAVVPAFLKQPEGFKRLNQAYGLEFESLSVSPHFDELFELLKKKQIEIITLHSTSYHLLERGYRTVRDDKDAFLPYEAAPILRDDVLKKYPLLTTAMKVLSPIIHDGHRI